MLRLSASLFALMLCAAVAWSAGDGGKGRDGVDDHMGAIWRFTLTRGDAKVDGQFRVYKGEVFKKDKKVGTVHKQDEDETTITFTDWDEMNGKAVLRKTRRHPPGAEGKLHKKDGTTWDMSVTWKDG